MHSFPADEIVEDVRRAVEGGCREIWLTSEDTAAYRWKGIRLPQLLKTLVSVEGRFYIRVGMMTPNQALPILEDLVKVYQSEKIFKFLHVPVQSGDDDILRKMRRRYTVDDFLGLVNQFRKKFQFLSLSTDIICGFPSETERQFMNSMELVQEVQPDILNISRFWPRSGTKAAEMNGQLHGRETKARSRKLTKLWRQLSVDRGRRWVGWKGEILIDEFGKNKTLLGRNYAYRPIVISAEADLGEFIKVRVTNAKVGYLLGQCV